MTSTATGTSASTPGRLACPTPGCPETAALTAVTIPACCPRSSSVSAVPAAEVGAVTGPSLGGGTRTIYLCVTDPPIRVPRDTAGRRVCGTGPAGTTGGCPFVIPTHAPPDPGRNDGTVRQAL